MSKPKGSGPSGAPRKSGDLLGVAMTSGLTLLAGLFIGYYGGRWLDGWAGTSPWFMLVGTMLGIVAGFRVLLRDILREGPRHGSRDPDTVPDQDPPEKSEKPDRG